MIFYWNLLRCLIQDMFFIVKTDPQKNLSIGFDVMYSAPGKEINVQFCSIKKSLALKPASLVRLFEYSICSMRKQPHNICNAYTDVRNIRMSLNRYTNVTAQPECIGYAHN